MEYRDYHPNLQLSKRKISKDLQTPGSFLVPSASEIFAPVRRAGFKLCGEVVVKILLHFSLPCAGWNLYRSVPRYSRKPKPHVFLRRVCKEFCWQPCVAKGYVLYIRLVTKFTTNRHIIFIKCHYDLRKIHRST